MRAYSYKVEVLIVRRNNTAILAAPSRRSSETKTALEPLSWATMDDEDKGGKVAIVEAVVVDSKALDALLKAAKEKDVSIARRSQIRLVLPRRPG
jgi:hypothetical protein